MQLDNAINKRRSIRKFSDKKVKFSDVLEAIDAAIQAPSAGNQNTIKFIIVEKQSMKNRLAECAQQDWLADASYIVIVCSEPKKIESLYHDRCNKYCAEQTGAAIENFLLKITDLKLASCWIGSYTDYYIKRDLEIPDEVEVSALLPVGYPAPNQKIISPRKANLDNVLRWDNWKNKYKSKK